MRRFASRRDFLKLSGTGLAAALGVGVSADQGGARERAVRYEKETPTICPYCAVGCGLLVHTAGGEIINVEGDPDHPINEGALCPKGASLSQLRDNKTRLTSPLYRAAGAAQWQEVGWEWAVEAIAKRVKAARDATFECMAGGAVVNRTRALASVGSAALDNEECYLYQKFLRGLGLVYIEHQARL